MSAASEAAKLFDPVCRPILMSGPLVTAILEGRKTQTRRVMKPQPIPGDPPEAQRCPYGDPGDLLWVRETWRPEELTDLTDGVRFKADDAFVPIENTREAADRWVAVNDPERPHRWRPSIHMPRWASRLTLKVTGIRVERVQAIPFYEIRQEGVSCPTHDFPGGFCSSECPDLRRTFASLWDSINEKRGFGWKANPWVWVVEFERVAS